MNWKKIIKITSSVLILSGALIFIPRGEAATIVAQQLIYNINGDAITNAFTYNDRVINFIDHVLTTPFDTVKIAVQDSETGSNPYSEWNQFALFETTCGAPWNGSGGVNVTPTNLIDASTTPTTAFDGVKIFTYKITPKFTPDPTKCYSFIWRITKTANSTQTTTLWGSYTQATTTVMENLNTSGTAYILDSRVKSPYYEISLSSNAVNSNSSINITNPYQNATTTDFTTWLGNFTDATSTSNPYQSVPYNVVINYGTDPNNLTYSDSQTQFVTQPANSIFLVIKNEPPLPATNTPYYAQAFLYDNFNTLRASSTITTFYFSTSGNPTSPTLIGIATSTSPYDITNGCLQALGTKTLDFGFIKFDITGFTCGLISLMFQPHQQVVNDLITMITSIKSKFPFNIFFDFENTISNYVNTQTNATGQNFSITLAFPQGNTNVNVLTPTMINDNLGSSVKNQLFTLEDYLIWLGLGFLILRNLMGNIAP